MTTETPLKDDCPSASSLALKILQECGLHPKYYDNIEKAAEGARDIIRSLRADLHDPPHDVQYAVLRKLGVESSIWLPIDSAPMDGTEIIVYCPPVHGLPHMVSVCAYQGDAGFCVDELREPTLWVLLPN